MVEPRIDIYELRIVKGFVVVGFMKSQGIEGARKTIGIRPEKIWGVVQDSIPAAKANSRASEKVSSWRAPITIVDG